MSEHGIARSARRRPGGPAGQAGRPRACRRPNAARSRPGRGDGNEIRRGLERAAAAITLAGNTGAEPLPAALRARLEQEAGDHFASGSTRASPEAQVVDVRSRGDRPARSPSHGPAAPAGWFAAAACLLLALFAWLRLPSAAGAAARHDAGARRAGNPAARGAAGACAAAHAGGGARRLARQAGHAQDRLGRHQGSGGRRRQRRCGVGPGRADGVIYISSASRPTTRRCTNTKIWIFDGTRDAALSGGRRRVRRARECRRGRDSHPCGRSAGAESQGLCRDGRKAGRRGRFGTRHVVALGTAG